MTTQLGNVPELGDWIIIAPWKTRAVVLIHIDGSGVPTQAHSITEKHDMLRDWTGTMLVGWNGKWKTDIRRVSPDEAQAVADRVG